MTRGPVCFGSAPFRSPRICILMAHCCVSCVPVSSSQGPPASRWCRGGRCRAAARRAPSPLFAPPWGSPTTVPAVLGLGPRGAWVVQEVTNSHQCRSPQGVRGSTRTARRTASGILVAEDRCRRGRPRVVFTRPLACPLKVSSMVPASTYGRSPTIRPTIRAARARRPLRPLKV